MAAFNLIFSVWHVDFHAHYFRLSHRAAFKLPKSLVKNHPEFDWARPTSNFLHLWPGRKSSKKKSSPQRHHGCDLFTILLIMPCVQTISIKTLFQIFLRNFQVLPNQSSRSYDRQWSDLATKWLILIFCAYKPMFFKLKRILFVAVNHLLNLSALKPIVADRPWLLGIKELENNL